jgi:BioD-like N-terminal domain of phosphotransacetylase
MAKTIFIATTEPYSGKSLVALGVLHMLLGKARKVAYFKPIINEESADKKDADIETVIQHFGVSTPYEDMYAFTRSQALQQMQNEGRGEIIDLIINKVKALEESNDFTVIEGSDFLGEGTAFEFEANVAIANNLSAPVIIVVSGQGKSTAQIVQNVQTVLSTFLSHDVQVLAVVVNKVAKNMVDDVQSLLTGLMAKDTLLCVIPKSKGLQSPTEKEIQEQIGGKILAGENLLTNQVDNFITGAMQLPNFLSHISENVLIVTPGDRGDIIIGAMQANLSANYPKVPGSVLTGGIEPEPQIMRMVECSKLLYH